MPNYAWQKSTFSPDASNCVYVAASPDGAIHIRESDEPDVILTTAPDRMHALIRALKTQCPPR